MRQQLEQRLQQLRTEFESGQKVLAELETKQTNIQSALLRIQGAIQVLEEELIKAEDATPSSVDEGLDLETVVVSTNSHG